MTILSSHLSAVFPLSGLLLRGLEHEREGDFDRPAGRGREAPARHQRLDAARDLGVAERVLLDVDTRDGAGLGDGPVDDDLTAQVRVALQRALIAGLDGAEARAHFLRDLRGIQLAIDGGRLALHDARDLLLRRARTGAAAFDRAAAAQAAGAGHAAGAVAAGLDAAQLVVAVRDAHATHALERLLLVAVDVALAEDVRDRALAVAAGAEQLQETGLLELIGQSGAALGVGPGLLLGSASLLLLAHLLLGGHLFLLGDGLLLLLDLLLFLLLFDGLLFDLLLFRLLLLDHLHETVGHRLDVRLARPVDAAQVDDERQVHQERDGRDDGEEPVDAGQGRPAHRRGQLRAGLGRGRRDELKQDRHVGQRDLPARALVQRQRPAGASLLDLPGLLQLRQRDDLVADRDARVHPVREVRDVLVAAGLEQQPVARQRIGRDHEHVLRGLADRDVFTLPNQSLLDDPPALNDPDTKDLGLRSRSNLRLS